jgi:hypothetical protein
MTDADPNKVDPDPEILDEKQRLAELGKEIGDAEREDAPPKPTPFDPKHEHGVV